MAWVFLSFNHRLCISLGLKGGQEVRWSAAAEGMRLVEKSTISFSGNFRVTKNNFSTKTEYWVFTIGTISKCDNRSFRERVQAGDCAFRFREKRVWILAPPANPVRSTTPVWRKVVRQIPNGKHDRREIDRETYRSVWRPVRFGRPNANRRRNFKF